MTRKTRLAAAALAALATAPGCVSCRPEVCPMALEAGPACELPAAARDKVYVFLVNGVSVFGVAGFDKLRDTLADAGYCKVGYGQAVHLWWMKGEMKRIHANDPDARFVVVGYDLGGPVAAALASDVTAAGVPVEAVVLLDPTGKPGELGCDRRTVLVTSGSVVPRVARAEHVAVADASHFSLPTHPQTVATLKDILDGVAQQVWLTVPHESLSAPWKYEHAPPPWPEPSAPPPGSEPWQFLRDQPSRITPELPPLPPSDKLPMFGSQPRRPGPVSP